MTYIRTIVEYGRSERSIDLPRFAADFARELGGKVLPHRSEFPSDGDRYQEIAVGDAKITVSTRWNERSKVTLDIGDLERPLNGAVPYGDQFKTPTITVSVDRPMKALVNDVKRRLIVPSFAPRNARRAYAAEKAEGAEQLKQVAAELRKQGLECRFNDGESYHGGLYYNKDGRYLSGRFYNDGRVTLERLDLTAEQAKKVFKVLGIA